MNDFNNILAQAFDYSTVTDGTPLLVPVAVLQEVTRAETEVHIVGSATDMRLITEMESHSQKRNSYLVEMLSPELNSA